MAVAVIELLRSLNGPSGPGVCQATGRFFRLGVVLVVMLLFDGCAATSAVRDEQHGIRLEFEAVADSRIPRYTATMRLNAPIADVMAILTDFGGWPQWVYGCKRVEILKMVGYQEAYLYQVTRLPVVRDRGTILHARLSSDDAGDEIVIRFEAAPEYCLQNARSSCVAASNERLVRVSRLQGFFRLRQISGVETELVWQQHFEPGGLIPAWATRWILPRVPLASLRRLRFIVEGPAASRT